MQLLIATTNPHKLEEVRAVMSDPAVALLCLADVPGAEAWPEAIEDGQTFEANAMKKASHYAGLAKLPTLADDSGLAVDALDGAPGVYSARYSGVTGPRREIDLANNRKLLAALAGAPIADRTARFVCAMAFVPAHAQSRTSNVPHPTLNISHISHVSHLEGRILTPDETADPGRPEFGRGDHGFGYDPLFLLPDLGQTTAELAPAHKNRISHRGQAARQMWEQLRAGSRLRSGSSSRQRT